MDEAWPAVMIGDGWQECQGQVLGFWLLALSLKLRCSRLVGVFGLSPPSTASRLTDMLQRRRRQLPSPPVLHTRGSLTVQGHPTSCRFGFLQKYSFVHPS